MSVLRAIVVGVLLVMVLALFEPKNIWWINLVVYVPLLSLFAGLGLLVQRGAVKLVGWVLSLSVWAVITTFLFFLGGLEGHNAMARGVAMTIAGTVVGGRAAVVVALLSIASSLLVLVLQVQRRLPPPLAPPNGFNAFTSSRRRVGAASLRPARPRRNN
jgi:hypothetical protein